MRGMHTDEEPVYFSEPDFDALENKIDTQHKKYWIHEKARTYLIILKIGYH